MRRRRRTRTALKAAEERTPRPYCRACRGKRMVEGQTIHNGETHPAMVECQACKIVAPGAVRKPDHAERAAGERGD